MSQIVLTISDRERLLLKAALCQDAPTAIASWEEWASQISLEAAPYPELRLFNAVHENLTRIASSFPLPRKLDGVAKATFVTNNHIARQCLPVIEAIGQHSPIMIMKGLAMCIRHNTWSSRAMGDADVQIPFERLEVVADMLEQSGWVPKYGLSWTSLVHRTALRRSSWNVARNGVELDLHWRAHAGVEDPAIARQMWATAEPAHYFNRSVLIQSHEFAMISILDFGFMLGSPAEKLQAIVDTSKVLPKCNPDILMPLIARRDLFDTYNAVVSTVEAAKRPAGDRESAPIESAPPPERTPPVVQIAPSEDALLRSPASYRLWTSLGSKAVLERSLIRSMGPLSKPFAWSGAFEDDYDLTNLQVVDKITGIGWGCYDAHTNSLWSDRADARLLVPLKSVESCTIVLTASDDRVRTPNNEINVFANGHFITKIEIRESAISDYAFSIPRHLLFGPWIELSLRAMDYRGTDPILTMKYFDGLVFPARRLQVIGKPGVR